MRIVSLVPSITKSLFDFGLTEKEVVGRTKFCVHPAERVANVAVIGGTKNLQLDKIRALHPDLIIANKEENEKEQVESLMDSADVWVTDVSNLEDNANFISELGDRLNRSLIAKKFNDKIADIFKARHSGVRRKSAYLIWKEPYMTVGRDTFIHDVLTKTGLENVFQNETRYPAVSVEQLDAAEVILLSSEPYPFKEKDIAELQVVFPDKDILLVDGEVFSWFGTHLASKENYLRNFTAKWK